MYLVIDIKWGLLFSDFKIIDPCLNIDYPRLFRDFRIAENLPLNKILLIADVSFAATVFGT